MSADDGPSPHAAYALARHLANAWQAKHDASPGAARELIKILLAALLRNETLAPHAADDLGREVLRVLSSGSRKPKNRNRKGNRKP